MGRKSEAQRRGVGSWLGNQVGAQALTSCVLGQPGTGEGAGMDVTSAPMGTASHSFPHVNESSSRPGLSCPHSRLQYKSRDNEDDSLTPARDVSLRHQPNPSCSLSPTFPRKSVQITHAKLISDFPDRLLLLDLGLCWVLMARDSCKIWCFWGGGSMPLISSGRIERADCSSHFPLHLAA